MRSAAVGSQKRQGDRKRPEAGGCPSHRGEASTARKTDAAGQVGEAQVGKKSPGLSPPTLWTSCWLFLLAASHWKPETRDWGQLLGGTEQGKEGKNGSSEVNGNESKQPVFLCT